MSGFRSSPYSTARPGANNNNTKFGRKVDFSALFQFSQIPRSTQDHLKKVYSSLALCMLVAAGGAYAHVTSLLRGGLASLLGSLGAMLWLAATPHDPKTERRRLAALMAFAFCDGLCLGPLLDYVVQVDPCLVPTALLGTAVVFVCFTLSALYARRRSYLYLGGLLSSALCLLLLASLANVFLGSVALLRADLALGALLFCGFVLFDTQLIIEKAELGDRDYVWHCLDLFIDFIAIFKRVMMLMAMNEKERKQKEKEGKGRDRG